MTCVGLLHKALAKRKKDLTSTLVTEAGQCVYGSSLQSIFLFIFGNFHNKKFEKYFGV